MADNTRGPAASDAWREGVSNRLLAEADPIGIWTGELSSSALSTATAVSAIALYVRARPHRTVALRPLIDGGAGWLVGNQNADGGWGDTVTSPSNVSTTLLSWVALGLVQRQPAVAEALARATARLESWVGELTAESISGHLLEVYGDDRTFSIPILTTCALGARFGTGPAAWRSIPAIPFELAAVPSRWFRFLGLPMVSYALPALIAMGQVRHAHRPTRNPVTRLLRLATRQRTLETLARIQPAGGGFLEAAPLTSFVTMSLVSCGQAGHVVVEKALGFLERTARKDGSWPIDSNLSVWLTTLSVNALAAGGRLAEHMSVEECQSRTTWLLAQQYRQEHPYTNAASGGWAWTDLTGGVPDADDTPGALLALRALLDAGAGPEAIVTSRISAGVQWLLDIQNRDGGIPTFCRGWGRMPFDRSSPDLTAHALRAWGVWKDRLEPELRTRVQQATRRAIRFLLRQQRESGAWAPLWFGNQQEPGLENPVYGTARVLLATSPPLDDEALSATWAQALSRGRRWLLDVQRPDGGWGGGPTSPSTIEETALAIEGLAAHTERAACERGVAWLRTATREGSFFPASPIGLYFSKLWYSERLYPLIFTVAALGRVAAMRSPTDA